MQILKPLPKRILILSILFLSCTGSFASDKGSNPSEYWYLQSWVWVLGAALVLLLILALLSNNNQSSKT